MSVIEEEKLKIEREKERLRIKENLIKEKEKRKRAKRFNEIGRIAFKANIDRLSETALIGAFLEISENMETPERLEAWEKKGQEFGSGSKSSNQIPVSVSFEDKPSKHERDVMKKLGFRWNAFRKEFYGYSKEEDIKKHLPDSKFALEVLK